MEAAEEDVVEDQGEDGEGGRQTKRPRQEDAETDGSALATPQVAGDREDASALAAGIVDCEAAGHVVDLVRTVDPARPWPGYTAFLDRYFTKLYATDVMSKPGEDMYVHRHLNGLCIVGVAVHHPILREGKTVASVDFGVSGKGRKDLGQVQVTGKRKLGAAALTQVSNLCRVSCTDGTSYMIRACVRGRLIEVNSRLVQEPGLLTAFPDTDGFVAILQPAMFESKHRHDEFVQHLMPASAYAALRSGDGNPGQASSDTVRPATPPNALLPT